VTAETLSDLERASRAALLRELELLKAQAARRDREWAAQHMSAAQWALVYGAPVPGQSRTVAEVAIEAQLAARGHAWRRGDAGPEVAYGPEPAGWR
jgi:hypothetical protein